MNLASTYEFCERFNPLTKDRSRGCDVEGFFYDIKGANSIKVKVDDSREISRDKDAKLVNREELLSANCQQFVELKSDHVNAPFKINGILSSVSLKLIIFWGHTNVYRGNQAAGIKETSSRILCKAEIHCEDSGRLVSWYGFDAVNIHRVRTLDHDTKHSLICDKGRMVNGPECSLAYRSGSGDSVRSVGVGTPFFNEGNVRECDERKLSPGDMDAASNIRNNVKSRREVGASYLFNTNGTLSKGSLKLNSSKMYSGVNQAAGIQEEYRVSWAKTPAHVKRKANKPISFNLQEKTLLTVAGNRRNGRENSWFFNDIGSRTTGKSIKTKRTNESRYFIGVANPFAKSLLGRPSVFKIHGILSLGSLKLIPGKDEKCSGDQAAGIKASIGSRAGFIRGLGLENWEGIIHPYRWQINTTRQVALYFYGYRHKHLSAQRGINVRWIIFKS